MKKLIYILPTLAALGLFTGCTDSDTSAPPTSEEEHGHAHEEGKGDHANEEGESDHEHGHEETPLGTFDIEGISIEAAQADGGVEAGEESVLILKLPYSDKGATIVRVWIGTGDRTLSTVGKGDYAPSHDDYDIHAVAPDPLPAGAKWWIEIEKPDGTKAVGSIPLLKDVKNNG
jgi:hypothetical protein